MTFPASPTAAFVPLVTKFSAAWGNWVITSLGNAIDGSGGGSYTLQNKLTFADSGGMGGLEINDAISFGVASPSGAISFAAYASVQVQSGASWTFNSGSTADFANTPVLGAGMTLAAGTFTTNTISTFTANGTVHLNAAVDWGGASLQTYMSGAGITGIIGYAGCALTLDNASSITLSGYLSVPSPGFLTFGVTAGGNIIGTPSVGLGSTLTIAGALTVTGSATIASGADLVLAGTVGTSTGSGFTFGAGTGISVQAPMVVSGAGRVTKRRSAISSTPTTISSTTTDVAVITATPSTMIVTLDDSTGLVGDEQMVTAESLANGGGLSNNVFIRRSTGATDLCHFTTTAAPGQWAIFHHDGTLWQCDAVGPNVAVP